jgi:hypothetical protein
MLAKFQLLAQGGRNAAANQWLGEHPLVLGLGALALGGLLAAYGAYELKTGVAHGKYGSEHTGGMGKLLAWVRIVFGVVIVCFGLYKIAAG